MATKKKATAKKKAVTKANSRKKIQRPNIRREDRPKEITEILGQYIGHFMTFKDKNIVPLGETNEKGRASQFKTQLPVVGIRLVVNLIDEDGLMIRDDNDRVMHVSVNVAQGHNEGRLDLEDEGVSEDANEERQALVDKIAKRYKMGDPVRIRQTHFLDTTWTDWDEIPPVK